MVIQTTLFTSNYDYVSSCACLNTFPTEYGSYLLKLIYICDHFPTVNNRRYGRCYVEKFIPMGTSIEFHTRLKANSTRSFQNAFYK